MSVPEKTGTAPAVDPATSGHADVSQGLVRRLGPVVATYAASRLVVLFAAHIADVIAPDKVLSDILQKWDAGWYLTIVVNGYDRVLPAGGKAPSNVAFFPLLPLLIDGLVESTGLSPLAAGITVSVVGGLLGALALYFFVEHLAGADAALRAAGLWSFFPAAFVFSTIYTEGLFVAGGACCLLFLLKERWELAGLAGAVASATRPNGLVLAACCTFVAIPAAWRRRSLRPLTAVVLAPLGAVGYAVFLQVHTGSPANWVRANAGFGQEADFGVSVGRGLLAFARNPLADFNRFVAVSAVLVMIVGVILLIVQRQPLVLGVYVAGIMGPVLLKTGFGATSRYLMTAFPVIFVLAVSLRRPWTYSAVLATSAGAMTALMVISGATLALTP